MPTTPASGYQYFYDQAMKNYQPAINQETATARAGLADQGLIASTAGQGKLADIRGKYLAAAQQAATEPSQRAQEFGVNSAMRAWELINSRALALKQLMGSKAPKNLFANPTNLMRDLGRQRFLPPVASSGPYGDPKEQDINPGFDSFSVGGKTLQQTSMDDARADSAAMRAIQNAQLQLDRERLTMQKQAMDDEQGGDPFTQMARAALANRDIDPAKPGDQGGRFPSSLLAEFESEFKVDIEEMAKRGDERAIAIMKNLYPLTWQQRIGAGRTASPTVAQATPAAAMNTPRIAPFSENYARSYARLYGQDEVDKSLNGPQSLAQEIGYHGSPTANIAALAKTLWDNFTIPR